MSCVPMIRALVPYFGSNRMSASLVGNHFQGIKWLGIVFSGSLSEIVYLQHVRTIVCNDRNRALINLCNVIRHPVHGPVFIRYVRRLILHPDIIAEARNHLMFDTIHGDCDIKHATSYYVMAWMTRSGALGTRSELKAPQSIRWEAAGGDSAVRFRSACQSLLQWRRYMQWCTFVCMDYKAFLDKCKDTVETGIYCDPPFPGEGDSYKHNIDSHVALRDRLNKFTNARILVRYYKNPEIEELYHGWSYKEVVAKNQSNDEKTEVYYSRG